MGGWKERPKNISNNQSKRQMCLKFIKMKLNMKNKFLSFSHYHKIFHFCIVMNFYYAAYSRIRLPKLETKPPNYKKNHTCPESTVK